MSTKTKVRTIRTSNMQFYILPVDQGQIVVTSYAVCGDGDAGEILRRTYDQNDGSVSYDLADLIEMPEGEEREFSPQNGILPHHGTFEAVEDIGVRVID